MWVFIGVVIMVVLAVPVFAAVGFAAVVGWGIAVSWWQGWWFGVLVCRRCGCVLDADLMFNTWYDPVCPSCYTRETYKEEFI